MNRIGFLKQMLYDCEGIPPSQQRLVCSGKQLQDERFLYESRISAESSIDIHLRLRGGSREGANVNETILAFMPGVSFLTPVMCFKVPDDMTSRDATLLDMSDLMNRKGGRTDISASAKTLLKNDQETDKMSGFNHTLKEVTHIPFQFQRSFIYILV